MLRDGFLRFCDDPEIACWKAEAELGRLCTENTQLRAELLESQRREKAAVECLNVLEPCEFCKHYDENCICARPLDYGNCFEWRGTREEGEGDVEV